MKSVPPFFISGSARCAMRMKDQTETSIVTWKPSRGTSVTRPPSASLVEKAIEWTRKSSLPQSCGDPLEDRLELAVGHHVHRHEDRRLDLAGQRLDVRLRLVVEVGDRELGAEGAEGAGAAPGDRAVVGDADDQALLAVEQLRLDGKGHVASGSLGRRADEGEGVAGDHQLLVGRDDEEGDAARWVEMRRAPASLAPGRARRRARRGARRCGRGSARRSRRRRR